MKSVFLLTGQPGTGKTSLIKQAIGESAISAGGFYTEEIRIRGTRVGFKLVTLDGHEAILSHIDFSKRFRVGKYGVDIKALCDVGVSAIKRAIHYCDLVVIDEIGRMELLSTDFCEVVKETIDSGKRTLGTIMLNAHPHADGIKSKPQVNLVTLTHDRYSQTLMAIREWLLENNYSVD